MRAIILEIKCNHICQADFCDLMWICFSIGPVQALYHCMLSQRVNACWYYDQHLLYFTISEYILFSKHRMQYNEKRLPLITLNKNQVVQPKRLPIFCVCISEFSMKDTASSQINICPPSLIQWTSFCFQVTFLKSKHCNTLLFTPKSVRICNYINCNHSPFEVCQQQNRLLISFD